MADQALGGLMAVLHVDSTSLDSALAKAKGFSDGSADDINITNNGAPASPAQQSHDPAWHLAHGS